MQVTNLVISSKQTRYSSQIASWWHRHLAFPASIYHTCEKEGWMDQKTFLQGVWMRISSTELSQKSYERQLLS